MGSGRRALLVGIAAAAALAGGVSASKAEGRAARREELRRVRAQLEAVRRQIETYQTEEENLSGRIDSLRKEREAAAQRLRGLQRELGATGRRRRSLERHLAALKRTKESWKVLLHSEADAYAEVLATESAEFSARGLWEEALRRAAIIQKIEWLREIEGAHRSAQGRAVRAQERSRALLSQKQVLESLERRRESEAAEIARGQRIAHEMAQEAKRKAEELARTEAKLEELLSKFAARARRPSPAASLRPHSLPWPCPGRVLEPFGKAFDPHWRATVIHEGILLETDAGSGVKAVLPGRIIFVGPFHSYGLVVILEHRAGYFSIYGRLGKALKRKGEEAAAGEEIAVSGKGPGRQGVLYFELRRAAEALDPLVWLAPSWREKRQ